MTERDIERAQESAKAAEAELARWNGPNGDLAVLRERRKSRIERKKTKDT